MTPGNGAALLAVLEALAAQLTEAGIPASTDPAGVPVPGAWVAPDTLGGRESLAGQGTATVTVWLVIPEASYAEALVQLTTALDAAFTVVTPTGDVTFGQALALPSNQAGLPAVRFQVSVQL